MPNPSRLHVCYGHPSLIGPWRNDRWKRSLAPHQIELVRQYRNIVLLLQYSFIEATWRILHSNRDHPCTPNSSFPFRFGHLFLDRIHLQRGLDGSDEGSGGAIQGHRQGGTHLTMRHSTITNCRVLGDGAPMIKAGSLARSGGGGAISLFEAALAFNWPKRQWPLPSTILQLNDTRIDNCTTDRDGGGIFVQTNYVFGSPATGIELHRTTISHCFAERSAGAVYIAFTNSLLTTLPPRSVWNAIRMRVEIHSSHFISCSSGGGYVTDIEPKNAGYSESASIGAGAISLLNTDATLLNSVFVGCSTRESVVNPPAVFWGVPVGQYIDTQGGCILSWSSQLYVTACSFVRCMAAPAMDDASTRFGVTGASGGAIAVNGGSVWLLASCAAWDRTVDL